MTTHHQQHEVVEEVVDADEVVVHRHGAGPRGVALAEVNLSPQSKLLAGLWKQGSTPAQPICY
jgi:hypothetical protein